MDGADILSVWSAAEAGLRHARSGNGPAFIWAQCVHLEGHFLGDPLLDKLRRPGYSFRKRARPMLLSFFRRGGAPWPERMAALRQILGMVRAAQDQTDSQNDPLVRARRTLLAENPGKLEQLESAVQVEIRRVVAAAGQPAPGGAK